MSRVRFTSSRDPSVDVDFETAMLAGQPRDGGLFVPAALPEVAAVAGSGSRSVADLARTVLPIWIGRRLAEYLDWSDVFSFPIPIVPLTGAADFDGISIVELFHGPTGSFKDFGARFLAASISVVRSNATRPAAVIVATSGDTGSAVADAFSGRSGVSVVVLYPQDGVSPIQEAQLTTPRENVTAVRVAGTFDDCQRTVKEVLRAGIPDVDIVSANSINVGRLVPQMLFYLAAAAGESTGEKIRFVVPCGNLGNLTAGLLARHSGIPGCTFLAATNENDFFAREAVDSAAEIRPLVRTSSNAMDVAEPSNLERIRSIFERGELDGVLDVVSVDDKSTKHMMGKVYRETGYVADPHTAVALGAARSGSTLGDRTSYVMSTAHPAKFRALVESETGVDVVDTPFGETPADAYCTVKPAEATATVRRLIGRMS